MKNNSMRTRIGMRKDGYTLIEVMVAVAILGIGIMGVASMQLSAIKGNNTARKITSNATWAMDRIERLIALPYAHADLTGTVYDDSDLVNNPLEAQGTLHAPGADTDGLDNNLDGQIDEDGETGDMSIEWRVVDDYPFTDIKTIRITMAQGAGSEQKSVSITTYKMDTI